MPDVDRHTRHAPHGMVSTVDHLATSAGVAVLRDGGNAVDAAVAASAVLAVTAPHLCGMGGDLFALVHLPGEPMPAALRACGRAGSGADADRLLAEGHERMPFHGDLRSAPVPGCVDGWTSLLGAHGRLAPARVLADAIALAEGGFPASPLLAGSVPALHGRTGADDLVTTPAMRPGDLVRRPGVGRALRAVAADGRSGFYEGEFGAGLLALGGGEYAADDLARSQADWVEPLRIEAWEHVLWTIPAPSQGYLTLLGAAVAAGLDLPDDRDDGAWAHLLVEAARAAGHDRPAVLHEHADLGALLEPREVERRRALVDPARRAPLPANVADGGTMHLCTADREGMAVSLIQSNASGFGCLVFEPSTGIGLHNRGLGFTLEPGHPARYGPGRRPPHTLSPALVTRPDGTLRLVLGTMGGDSQPQVLLQLLARLLGPGRSATPGRAVSAPRWTLASSTGFDAWAGPDPGAVVQVEHDAPESWVTGLEARGHEVRRTGVESAHTYGHAHVVAATPSGWAGAADPRAAIGAASGH